MLDVIGALGVAAIFAIDVIALAGLAAIPPRARVVAYALAAAWLAAIVAIAAAGGFAPEAGGPVPGPVVAFGMAIVAGLVAWNAWPAFRAAMLSIPLGALVGVNALRVGGVFFILLWGEGRLAAPFAPSAGFGDILTGLAAVPLALMIARGRTPSKRWLLLWNGFGTLDLFAAIVFGALSAPGTPFRVFVQAPGTLAMASLPWLIVPTVLVPLYLLTHLTIAARLHTKRDRGAPLPIGRRLAL